MKKGKPNWQPTFQIVSSIRMNSEICGIKVVSVLVGAHGAIKS